MRSKIFLALATAAAVTACGDSSEPTESADATSTAAQQAVDPENPFAQAETAMNRRMMQAVGADVSDTWVKQMIEHHRGAIEMSEIMLAQNPSEHVRSMAEESIRKQTAEIEKLTRLVSGSQADPASFEPYHPVHQEMTQAMMAATGETVEQTYMRKMLAHHLGGVALSDVVLAQGGSQNARVREEAQKTRKSQADEAKMVEDMLAGRPMTESPTPSSTPAASADRPDQASSRTRSTPSPSPSRVAAPATPAASPRPAASPTADPHAGHDMTGAQ